MVDDKNIIATGFNNPSLQISPVKLNENNYLVWLRSCLLFMKVRGLWGYITGDTRKPALNNPTFNQYYSKNSCYGMAH